MKTILAPTDFSTASKNAVDYAAALAAHVDAKLVLFHSFHLPLITGEVPVIAVSLEEMEKECMEGLRKLGKAIQQKHDRELKIEFRCSCGFASEEIEKTAGQVKADLVVMGMRGAGILSEKFMGSITTDVIRKGSCTVLVIHEKVRYKSPKRFVLAYDFKGAPGAQVFVPVKEFAKAFKANTCILHVGVEEEVLSDPKAAQGLQLEERLKGIRHTYHFINDGNVIEGINDFIRTAQIDLVVMIHHEKGIWGNLFHPSHTKHMAFHTQVPLLVLSEKNKSLIRPK
jgi:nucleotide-binding universal stress UspA family protein